KGPKSAIAAMFLRLADTAPSAPGCAEGQGARTRAGGRRTCGRCGRRAHDGMSEDGAFGLFFDADKRLEALSAKGELIHRSRSKAAGRRCRRHPFSVRKVE